MPEDLKKVKALTPDHVRRVFTMFAEMNRAELQGVLEDPDSPMMHIVVGSILAKAAKEGDGARLDFILNRTVGKVKEVIETTHNFQLPTLEEARKILAEDPANGEAVDVKVEEL